MPELSPGKARCLTRLSDGVGRYGLIAIDQRPPIFEVAARAAKPGKTLPEKELTRRTIEIKALLARTFARDVTGLLVDPAYAYAAVMPDLPRRTGLMLTLEHHEFKTDAKGFRTSGLIPRWDVDQAVRAGAEGLKLLAWYRPDAPKGVCAHQQKFVQAVGEACRAADRPFIFEILTYRLPKESAEDYARKLPDLLMRSVAAFAAPRFGVDLYKLPIPADAGGVKEWGGKLYALDAVKKNMARITKKLPAPWLLLSGGLDSRRFVEAFEAAVAAGCRGYLAGRAVWLEPLAVYPDLAAAENRLRADGRAAVKRLNTALLNVPARKPEADWRLPISR